MSQKESSGPEELPAGPGTYCLVLRLPEAAQVTPGRLGTFELAAGWYLYIGSALGGLRGRLLRHLRTEKRRRWHIDYLLSGAGPGETHGVAEIVGAWWVESTGRLECEWAQTAIGWPGASVPIPRFGSSDCRCRAHLVAWPRPEELGMVREELLRLAK
jgi:Uri superfamily endonuclease